jgi:hypothetical protein
MTVRAKFYVESVREYVSVPGQETLHEVALRPVVGGNPENEQFFKWTPYGEMKIGTVNAEVAKQLSPGRVFYVDFTPAE